MLSSPSLLDDASFKVTVRVEGSNASTAATACVRPCAGPLSSGSESSWREARDWRDGRCTAGWDRVLTADVEADVLAATGLLAVRVGGPLRELEVRLAALLNVGLDDLSVLAFVLLVKALIFDLADVALEVVLDVVTTAAGSTGELGASKSRGLPDSLKVKSAFFFRLLPVVLSCSSC